MIEIDNLKFTYGQGVFCLYVPQLEITAGQRTVVIGPSGSGKTTLLHLMAGILSPDRGSVRVDGQDLTSQSDVARRNFRVRRVGMVFQQFELLEYLSVLENMLLPYRINRTLTLDPAVRENVHALAENVGISTLLQRYPDQLSQGERQRVAVCRALVTQPSIILADEPTGNLDPRTGDTIVRLILDQAEATGATVLMVTHDHSLLDRFDRVIDFETLMSVSDEEATA